MGKVGVEGRFQRQGCKLTVAVSQVSTLEGPEPSSDCGVIGLGAAMASESFKTEIPQIQPRSLSTEKQQNVVGDYGLSCWDQLHNFWYKVVQSPFKDS